jgi:AcrR family transcriptional regulator
MGIRQEQRERTRAHLVDVAHGLFAERGYADVGLAEIVATAGVTKGALYHHFENKLALFGAVVETVAQRVGERVGDRDLLAGCEEFLRAATSPDVVRVLLIDAPAVLGWQRWHDLDDQHSVAHLREGLAEQGISSEALVRCVSGALNEAARWIATLPVQDRETAVRESTAVVRRLLPA